MTGRKTLITRNNKMMAFVDMEDLYGTVEVVVFPNVYERYGALTAEDSIISVAGTINFKEGEVPKLLANRITDIRALGELAADEGAEDPAPVDHGKMQAAVRTAADTVQGRRQRQVAVSA